MQILVVGLNDKTAPVEIRECITFQGDRLNEALTDLRERRCVLESVILSTCNRTELYLVVDSVRAGIETAERFISERFSLPLDDVRPYLYVYTGEEAVDHLFTVASGLDSMVLGETQILGQVKAAWELAREENVTGKIFNYLFKQAVTLAKRIHDQIGINDHPVSVSYAAVTLIRKVYETLKDKRVMIIGAGKMGELTLKHLLELGAKEIIVANRSIEKAKELAAAYQARAISLAEMEEVLPLADVLISSTGAPGYILTRPMVEQAMKRRKGNPLFMVDIAVPRDLDPAIHELESVYLYDIDDLKGIVDANLAERKNKAEQARLLIEQEKEAFEEWYETLAVIPVIDALRKKAYAIQEETMRSIERKIPDLDERELKVLQKHTKSIVNQMLKDPIIQLKEMASDVKSREALALLIKLFALEEYMNEGENEQSSTHLTLSPLDTPACS